jgi:hypothetical protein
MGGKAMTIECESVDRQRGELSLFFSERFLRRVMTRTDFVHSFPVQS